MANETRQVVATLFGLGPTDQARLERAGARAPTTPFSPFVTEDAQAAGELADHLGAIADAESDRAAGLAAASKAALEVAESNPGLARHGFGLFATHHPRGKGAPIPSLLRRIVHKAMMRPTDARSGLAPEVGLGSGATGAEAALDWFRDDPLSNEHHEHWHWVYPNQRRNWAKARHGELFYYMHQQMLARYDAERAALGMSVVDPITDFDASIGAGYDPGALVTSSEYGARDADEAMLDAPEYGITREGLTILDERISTAATTRILGFGPNKVGLDGHEGSDLLAREAEPNGLARFGNYYVNHHGFGHVLIAKASAPGALGVMANPDSAIRDPAFWRWHRRVDDIHFAYQDQLGANDFSSDAPNVRIAGLSAGAEPLDLASLDAPGRQEAADRILAAQGPAELTTTMRKGVFRLVDEESTFAYEYLSHDSFAVALALENPGATPLALTVRLFLLPDVLLPVDVDLAVHRSARRFVIELDKVKVTAPPGRSLHLRAGRDMSVIRRPAVIDPVEVADVLGDNDPPTMECTCGWPYTLLLPRGRSDGMPFHLFAMITDNEIDRVGSAKPCGSMSFCGIGDDYPDSRAMGYPFDRPFKGTLADIVVTCPNMALAPVSIRWTNPPAPSP